MDFARMNNKEWIEWNNFLSDAHTQKAELAGSINACEDEFKGIIKWPLLGGTFDEFIRVAESLQADNAGQMVTVGLKADFDESARSCCERQGNVTGLLHILAEEQNCFTREEYRIVWDNVERLDKEGRQPGFYSLCVHSFWLLIMKSASLSSKRRFSEP
jgi:hypothetical protein